MNELQMDKSSQYLLSPRSVAFIGISAKGGAGAKMLRSALRFNFSGEIWPINPNSDMIEGVPCVPSLSDLPKIPDCLVISVPAGAVLSVLEEAAEMEIRAALVVSEGFADSGTDEGLARQARLIEIAKSANMAIAGPNCMGIATLEHGFAATMADIPEKLFGGGVSLVSQSGGLINAAVEFSSNRGIGLNYLISIGNQAVLDLADYIDFLADDPKTTVIACIMEGAKNGRRFRAAVERASRKKPLVILKLGKSEAGQAATLAHTGTLAGKHEAYEALFQRNGVAMVLSIDELVETAAFLSVAPMLDGKGVCLLTVSGGATSLISDLGDSAGLSFPPISAETNRRIGEALGIERDFGNPMDTVGMPRLRQDGALDAVLAALLDDPKINIIGLVLGMRGEGAVNHDKLVNRLSEIAVNASKPVFVLSFISNSLTSHWAGYAARTNLPLIEDVECGLRAVRHLVDYSDFRRLPAAPIQMSASSQVTTHEAAVNEAIGDEILSEAASKIILAAADLPVTRELLAKTPSEAAILAAQVGGEVAIKIQSADIPHKFDVGGVHLGATASDAEAAATKVFENSSLACPDAKIEGVLVQEMVEDGAEFILGMNYDSQFGPLIVLGGGGIMVEVFKDAAVRLAPLSYREADEMISSLKASVQLDGFRGSPVCDREALAECIVKFSDFAAKTDGLYAAIDLNPVIVSHGKNGVKIADALIIKRNPREDM